MSPEVMTRWLEFSYASHEAAAAFFKAIGLAEVVLIPPYTPSDFQRRLQAKLSTVVSGVRVFDLTDKVPTTPSGNLRALVKLIDDCRSKSLENERALFYFQRTAENSTAFVHLMAYGNNLELPKVVGELPGPALDASYAGVVIFRHNEVTIPARLCISSAELMADFVASMLDVSYHGFKCGECGQPFVRWQMHRGTHVRALDDLLLSDCAHVFHPGCIVHRMRGGRPNCDRCPVCAVPLPVSIHPSEGAVPIGNDGSLLAQTPISTAELAAIQSDPAARFHAAARAEYNANSIKRAGFSTKLVASRAGANADLRLSTQVLLRTHSVQTGSDEWWALRAIYRKDGDDAIVKALNTNTESLKNIGVGFKFSQRLRDMICDDPVLMRSEVETLGMDVDELLAAKATSNT